MRKTSFTIARLYAGQKLLGYVVDILETNDRTKRHYRLRDGNGIAIFATREEAIRAARSFLYSR